MPYRLGEALEHIADKEADQIEPADFRNLSAAYAADQQRIMNILTAHVGNAILWVYALADKEDIDNDPEVRDLVVKTLHKINDAIDQMPRHIVTKKALRLQTWIQLATLTAVAALILIILIVFFVAWRWVFVV